MILMPIVYVTDMARSIEFYASLGFALASRSDHWSELTAGDGAVLALHLATSLPDPTPRVELALVALEPLEQVQERYRDALSRAITDEAFGRSLALRDPDGLEIFVNEHDREAYAPA